MLLGDQARLQIVPVCPASSCSIFPVAMFQMRTSLSVAPVASDFPSGDHVMRATPALPCEISCLIAPVVASRIRREA